MTVRLVPARDPGQVPQFTLWTMRKNGRTREARVRLLPVGEGLVELAIYDFRTDGTPDLLWGMTLSGPDVNELAQEKQREYEVRGWILDVAPADEGAVEH